MRRPDFSRRVAVTGLGIVSPVGTDVPTAWNNLVEGRSGLREVTYWDPDAVECSIYLPQYSSKSLWWWAALSSGAGRTLL